MNQVRVSRWSKGRFVLLGDTACCPTAFMREGTALVLVDAYVLAGEIKRSIHSGEAFGSYEAFVRPYGHASQRRINPVCVRLTHA